MNLFDARHNINTLVFTPSYLNFDDETMNLMVKSWRLIQEELTYASIARGKVDAEAGRLTVIDPFFGVTSGTIFECQGQGSTEVCDDCAEDMC